MIALQVQDLSKKFILKQALDSLSVSFEKGKIIGLLGPNGSGKSTFMRIAAGLLQPSGGKVIYHIDGEKTHKKDRIAFMPTESHLYEWMSIQESIDFYHKFFHAFDKAKAQKLIVQLELEAKQKIKSLSTGQRGRLKAALTLCRTSDVYLIDEPLNGLDPISRDMILDLLASQVDEDKCIIISSHLVHEFERICDEIVFIKNGRLEMKGDTESLRIENKMSIHELYKEVYKYA